MGSNVLITPEWHPWPEAPVEGSWGREQAAAAALFNEVAILTTRPGAGALRPRFELSDSVEDGLRTLRVRYTQQPLRKASFLVRLRAMFLGLRELRKSGFTPDVIHAKVFSAGFPSVFLARRLGVPLIVSEHYTGFPRGSLSRYDRLIASITFRAADLVCPDSQDLGGYLKALQPRARLRAMPNVVDTRVFRPGEVRGNDGPVRLLNVASLHDKKGHEYLLEALARLRREGEDVVLDVVGDGPRRDELEALARRLGIQDQARFLGIKSSGDVAALMRGSDVFVLPSLWENAPHVVLEALASGLPLVATDVGGVSELFSEDEGVLVPAADPERLALAVRDVSARRSEYSPERLSRHARERFGHERVGRLWTEVYGEVVAR
jgi:glycosyltransferase involved in cell wall biosynthesis